MGASRHHKVQEEETQWPYVYHMNPTTSHFTLHRNQDQGPGRRNPIHSLHGCSSCRKRRRFGSPVGHDPSPAGCGAVGSESGSGEGSSGIED